MPDKVVTLRDDALPHQVRVVIGNATARVKTISEKLLPFTTSRDR